MLYFLNNFLEQPHLNQVDILRSAANGNLRLQQSVESLKC